MESVCYNSVIGCDVHQKILVCHSKQLVGEAWVDTKATFPTNYNALDNFVDWAKELRPQVVVLESTGVYWQTPFTALEEGGLNAVIVNPSHVRRMIGRKTDMADAEWLAQVGVMGTFTPSYIPPKVYRDLRVISRNISKLTGMRQSLKNRENKFFIQSGFRLSVFSDQFGKAATIAKDMILEGKSPDEIVAAIRNSGIRKLKATGDELRDAFHGNLTEPIRKAIYDNRDLLQSVERKIESESVFITDQMKTLEEKNFRLLLTIPGIDELSAAQILIELGGGDNFVAHFSSAKRASAWQGMSPGNNESGGKRYSGRSRKGNKSLRRIYCEAAQAAVKTKGTTLKSKFDCIVGRLGRKRAIFAIGNKICKLVYFVLKNGTPYEDPQVNYQELSCQRNAPRWIRQIKSYKNWEVTIRNTETGEVYTTEDQRIQHVFPNVRTRRNSRRSNNPQ